MINNTKLMFNLSNSCICISMDNLFMWLCLLCVVCVIRWLHCCMLFSLLLFDMCSAASPIHINLSMINNTKLCLINANTKTSIRIIIIIIIIITLIKFCGVACVLAPATAACCPLVAEASQEGAYIKLLDYIMLCYII